MRFRKTLITDAGSPLNLNLLPQQTAQGVLNHPPPRLVFKAPFLSKTILEWCYKEDEVRGKILLAFEGRFCPP